MEAYTISLENQDINQIQAGSNKVAEYPNSISLENFKINNKFLKIMDTEQNSPSFQVLSSNFTYFLENFRQSPQIIQRQFTSFQQKSMENHGIVLKKSFYKNLNLLPEQKKQEDRLCKTRKNGFNWEELEEILNQIEELDENSKTFLISKCKSNFEAFFIIKTILQFVPHEFEARCLKLIFCIFQYFDSQKVHQLQEEHIIQFIQDKHKQFGPKFCQQFIEGLNQSQLKQGEAESIKKMVFSWTKSIFLALSGIFNCYSNEQKEYRHRKCSFEQEIQTP